MKRNKNLLLLAFLPGIMVGRKSGSEKSTGGNFEKSSAYSVNVPDPAAFKTVIQNRAVSLYILKNSNGATVAITNYGGRLVSILMPDKAGELKDVILGHDNIQGYIEGKENYFGAIIGRYGNRIAKGSFSLGGRQYHLDVNDGVNTLHGGLSGFYNRVFSATQTDSHSLKLYYFSKDGEGGYPGNLSVTVTYSLSEGNALKVEYEAKSDKSTIINLTNHAYFNLDGAGSKTILDQDLRIDADRFTPVDNTLIPTGELQHVKGTPFDFTKYKLIGRDIETPDKQLVNGKGYDHNFVLNKHTFNQPVVSVKSNLTGITMDVYTTEPGVQFYSGNFLTGDKNDGKGHAVYGYRSAFCLETQHFPDSPNQPSFPSTILKPGETYRSETIYKFSK